MFGLFKKKRIVIHNKDEFKLVLTRIVEILRDNGNSGQADAVRKALQYLYLDDYSNFIKYLNTIGIWGGSGAAWEVGVFNSRKEEQEFKTCFIRLIELMNDTGIKNNKAESIANFFKKDLRQ